MRISAGTLVSHAADDRTVDVRGRAGIDDGRRRRSQARADAVQGARVGEGASPLQRLVCWSRYRVQARIRATAPS
eukprot:2386203-Heterocapsa_arctica.AAC.1